MADGRAVTPGAAACEHVWKRVRAVVVVVADPFASEKGGATYNAECERCGARAWLHWPPATYQRGGDAA